MRSVQGHPGEEDGDWTTGRSAIRHQVCRACGHGWYFKRSFCPSCGSADLEVRDASGRGTVYAATTVNRPPSEALRTLAPYRIVIVEADEGFRLMAHGAGDLAIDERVEARFERFGALLVPFFDRTTAQP